MVQFGYCYYCGNSHSGQVITSTADIAISDIALPTTSAPSTEVHLGKFPYRIIHLFTYL